jgi:hypothetical protein
MCCSSPEYKAEGEINSDLCNVDDDNYFPLPKLGLNIRRFTTSMSPFRNYHSVKGTNENDSCSTEDDKLNPGYYSPHVSRSKTPLEFN